LPTSNGATCIDADGEQGVREAFICVEGNAIAHSLSKTGVNALMPGEGSSEFSTNADG
jgi:hypothetical protein